jgi:hypothetical protein
VKELHSIVATILMRIFTRIEFWQDRAHKSYRFEFTIIVFAAGRKVVPIPGATATA